MPSSSAQLQLFDEPRIVRWLPDESLFSLCSRHHEIACHVDVTDTCLQLFGLRRAGMQHDFPTHIDRFTERTGGDLGESCSIIQRGTLLPFYLPLQSENAQRNLVDLMRSGRPCSMKARLGLFAMGMRAQHPLKACRSCMVEDRERFLTPYWHVHHQTPGTWMCLRHRELLVYTDVKVNGLQRFEWLLPSSTTLKAAAVSGHLCDSLRLELLALSQLCSDLLVLASGTVLCAQRAQQAIEQELERQAMVTRGGRFRTSVFQRKYTNLCSMLGRVQGLKGLDSHRGDRREELGRLLRNRETFPHPVRWLVVIRLVFGDWSTFKKRYDDVALGGSQGGVVEKRQKVSTAITQTRYEDFRKRLLAGALAVEAGRLLGLDDRTTLIWASRLQGLHTANPKVTKALRNRIQAALRSGLTQAKVAAKLKVDLVWVRCVQAESPELMTISAAARRGIKQQKWRAHLKAVVEANPGLSRQQIRSKCHAAFAWLRRNDDPWLESILPPAVPTSGNHRQIDWCDRDMKFAAIIQAAEADVCLHSRRRDGHSRKSLVRLLPELQSIEHYISRLPRTRAAIDRVVCRLESSSGNGGGGSTDLHRRTQTMTVRNSQLPILRGLAHEP